MTDPKSAPRSTADQETWPNRARVVVIYAVFAALWILLSDQAVVWLFQDPESIALVNTLKGWFFVAVTTLLLWLLLRRHGDRAAKHQQSRLLAGSAEDAEGGRGLGYTLLPMAILGVAIVVLTTVALVRSYNQQTAKLTAQLHTIVDLKTREIQTWLGEREGDARFLRDNHILAQHYLSWRRGGNPAGRETLARGLEGFRQGKGYSAITLRDGQGQLLWGSERAPRGIKQQVAASIRKASQEDRVSMLGIYRGVAGTLRLDMLAPLLLAGPRPPVIVLHSNPSDWLLHTLQNWPSPSPSGETLLFRRDADQILFLNELRHRAGTAAKLRIPLASARLLAAQVARDPTLQGHLLRGVDYRGVPSLGMARAVPGTDWYLIAKLDRSESLAEVMPELAWISLAGMLALLMTGAGAYLMRQHQDLRTSQRIRLSQVERLRALRLLASISDSSEDAIFAQDLEGRYLLFNRAAERFTGKKAADVLGKDDQSLFPPEEAQLLREIGQQVIAGNRAQTNEECLSTPQGKRIFLVTKGPLLDDQGQVIGVFGIARDITERKQADEILAEQGKRIRALLNNSRDGIVIINQDHKVVEANRRFAEMLGYELDELPDLHTWDFDAVMDEAQIRAGFQDVNGLYREFETRHRRKDGGEYDVEISASGTQWGDQSLVLCVCRDITERKRADESLSRWTEELRQRNEELERFNRVMVDRELEMIELKRQINALAEELGREPPYRLASLEQAGGLDEGAA